MSNEYPSNLFAFNRYLSTANSRIKIDKTTVALQFLTDFIVQCLIIYLVFGRLIYVYYMIMKIYY